MIYARPSAIHSKFKGKHLPDPQTVYVLLEQTVNGHLQHTVACVDIEVSTVFHGRHHRATCRGLGYYKPLPRTDVAEVEM